MAIRTPLIQHPRRIHEHRQSHNRRDPSTPVSSASHSSQSVSQHETYRRAATLYSFVWRMSRGAWMGPGAGRRCTCGFMTTRGLLSLGDAMESILNGIVVEDESRKGIWIVGCSWLYGFCMGVSWRHVTFSSLRYKVQTGYTWSA